MALICKDNWDLLCSIKKYHNQFSYSAAQQALQILILWCRIYFFFERLLQACVLGLHFYSFSFSEEFSALRSWHPFDSWQQAMQPVWRLQCHVELSARPEQTCCGTEGCPSPAMWSWYRLLLLLHNTLSCILQAKSSADTTGNTSLTPEDVKLFTCYRWSLQAAYPFSCCCI